MAGPGLIAFLGFALFFNVAVILAKFQRGMETNAIVDAGVLGGIFYLFNGSMSALAIGTVASMLFSIYLFFVPLDLEDEKKDDKI